MRKCFVFLASLALTLLMSGGCAVNPVTGEQELSFVSTEQELAIGQKNYGPYRQAEGGDYTLDPALTRYVRDIGERLVRVSDRKLPYEFSIVNDSTPNAWALPGGKIALNRGLLVELRSEAELAAVLGHEIVHAAARHSAQGMQRGVLMQGALIAASVALGDSGYRDLAMTGAQLGANLTTQKYDRDAEREADFYGMRYMARAGYDPAAAVELQKTFVRLAEGRNQNWLGGLFASHPPSQERVDNNIATARNLGVKNGVIGRDRYKQMIARLEKTKPAYEAYDDAKKAMKAGDLARARALVDKAIRVEPRESLFQGLRGDLLTEQGDSKAALSAYNKAVAANPNYFKHYLTRGYVKRELGDAIGARMDFKRSLDLLPTAEGKYGLGRVALDSGNQNAAITYLQQAAATNSAVAAVAKRDLAKLGSKENPKRYIKLALRLDRQGFLSVAVKNQAPVTVKNVIVVLGRRTSGGLQREATYRLRGALRPGEQRVVRSSIGPLDRNSARGYGAAVADAYLVE